MSRMINLTAQNLEEIRQDFEAALKRLEPSDGKISFTKSFGSVNRKATLYFTETAYAKMQALIREFSVEIGWYGVAERGSDPNKDEYIISDILVYPQEITGTTVEIDEGAHDKWFREHKNDARMSNLFMQGHSHVNMAVSPSSVDLKHQKDILMDIQADRFYIFLIWNKRNEKNIWIYDFAKNVLFETADVSVEILDDSMGIQGFLREAKNIAKSKTFAASCVAPPVPMYDYRDYCGVYGGLKPAPAPAVDAPSAKSEPPKKGKKKRVKSFHI